MNSLISFPTSLKWQHPVFDLRIYKFEFIGDPDCQEHVSTASRKLMKSEKKLTLGEKRFWKMSGNC